MRRRATTSTRRATTRARECVARLSFRSRPARAHRPHTRARAPRDAPRRMTRARALGFAHVALECDARADARVGDALTIQTSERDDAHPSTALVVRATDASDDASARAAFDARALGGGAFARAFARFGGGTTATCVGERDARAETTEDDASGIGASGRERRRVLIVRCEVAVDGWAGRAFERAARWARIATATHLTSARGDARTRADARARLEGLEIGFCGVIGCRIHVGDRRATLSATLEELRPEMKRAHEPVRPAVDGYLCAGDLPEDVLVRILGFLDVQCAGALAATCRGFRSRVEETSPGLALTLHPHQRAALGWMRRRERPRLPLVRDPLWMRIDCEDGQTLWFDTIKGDLTEEHPEHRDDSQGGMLCDEPGLGKTVTALALVLARRGWRPSPPRGCTARKIGEGWYYEETNSGAGLGGYGSPMSDATPPTLTAQTPTFTPTKSSNVQSSSRGNSSGLRRSKRSAGSTPVGYFAAVCKNGLDGSVKSSSARRSKVEEQKAHEELAAATMECPDWRARLECNAHSIPIGFVARDGLKEDSARLARNTAHFEHVLRNCFMYIGRAATCDVVDYILENTVEVSHAMPLSMPPFRRSSDHPALFGAMGLVKFTGVGKLENALPFAPPGPVSDDLILDKQALHDAVRVVDNRGRDGEITRVWLSCATLIIIPSVLIEHWLNQILFCTGDGAERWIPRVAVLDKAPKKEIAAEYEIKSERTWEPTFLNDLSDVDASDLANKFDIVIMPIFRLSTEFSNIDTPILRVMWQRIILDEGHQLGASLSLTAKLSVACALKAHARWLMTGTPTPTTLKGAGTAHLQPLLGFLRQPFYGTSAVVWSNAVQRPLEGKDKLAQADAVVRLGEVLRRCMVRTCKSHISLPPLQRTTTMLKFSDVHAESYNDIVAHVKRSLLLADWGDPNHIESLLNVKNVREALAAVTNLREAACVVGKMPTTFDPDEFDETIRDLNGYLQKRGFGEEERKARIRRVSPTLMQCKGTCDLCMHEVIMPLITPCAHILCCGCVMQGPPKGKTLNGHEKDEIAEPDLPPGIARAPRGCPLCGSAYVMQKENPYNSNPAQAVPQDLIELQPSYVQHPWKVDESVADGVYAQGESSKVDHLLTRLRKIGAAVDAEVVRRQDERDAFFAREANGLGATTSGWSGNVNANPGLVEDSQTGRRRKKRRLDAAEPLRVRDFNPSAPPPKKCIVYSNFRPHLDSIDLALYGARVPHESITRMGQTRLEREQALKTFKNDPDVAVLLLNRAAAEGLDLSFVSYVFLMEPLSNISLEEQVVSRAHRMGQTQTVHVEVLAMEKTAEETMLDVQAELLRNPLPKEALEAMHESERVGAERNSNDEADVAPTIVAEALSRRRILERLTLVSSKASDDAAAKRAKDIQDHFDRVKGDGSGGRVLGDGRKTKGEEEEQHWVRKALEESAAELAARGGSVPEIGSPIKPVQNGQPTDIHTATTWIMRVRDPFERGEVKEFTLPNGGKTTASAMRARISTRLGANLDAYKIFCGFPPRALTDRDLSTSISLLGIRQNDLINLRDADDASDKGNSPTSEALVTTTFPLAENSKPASSDQSVKRHVDTELLDSRVRKRLSTMLKHAETSTEMMLQDPDADANAGGERGTASMMSMDLLRAAEGGSKRAASDPIIRSLQDAFKAVVQERDRETLGNAKCAAARAGNVSYSTLTDGRLVVKYLASDAGRATLTERSDCVQDLPRAIVPFVLAAVAADEQRARENLSPPAMAVASPRVFWAIVRHGNVGPNVTFTQALRSLAPNVADWDALAVRERRRNPRYADYDTTGA